MLFRKFSFAPMRKISNCSSHIVTNINGCALWRHSFQNSIRKLTVSYSDTFKHLIKVPRYTSSTLAFTMNATDHGRDFRIVVMLRRSSTYETESKQCPGIRSLLVSKIFTNFMGITQPVFSLPCADFVASDKTRQIRQRAINHLGEPIRDRLTTTLFTYCILLHS